MRAPLYVAVRARGRKDWVSLVAVVVLLGVVYGLALLALFVSCVVLLLLFGGSPS